MDKNSNKKAKLQTLSTVKQQRRHEGNIKNNEVYNVFVYAIVCF